MIDVINMTKIYRMGEVDIAALNDVSFHIMKGEFTSIIGPSGSGKSTLMNMLGCLDVPTSGNYKLDGKEISKLKDDELAEIRNHKIGFIFQGFNLLPKLNAFENVELPLIYKGISKKKRYQLSSGALERVGLADRMLHKPSELSGGQQQRVAIARALACDPPLILADEPTGNLDTKSGAEILDILMELNSVGNTILLITHDLNIANQTRRVIGLQDGKIIEDREVN